MSDWDARNGDCQADFEIAADRLTNAWMRSRSGDHRAMYVHPIPFNTCHKKGVVIASKRLQY